MNEQQHEQSDLGARPAAAPVCGQCGPAPSMLGAATAAMGGARVQQKIARRLMRRRMEVGGGGFAGAQEPLQRAQAETGASLDAPVQRQVAAATGADLSGVRVHTGAAAAVAAESLQARAFTVGQDIYFGAGQYQPGSTAGDHLIAHELVHTVQQQGAAGDTAQTKLEVSEPGDAGEVEADQIADRVVAGGAEAPCADCQGAARAPAGAPVQQLARAVIQRDGAPGTPAAPTSAAPGTATTGPAVPQPSGGAAPGAPGGAPGTCPDPAEQTRKDTFRRRTDMHLDNHTPSTGIGKFDCKYFPQSGIMPITVKINFNFVQADNTPGFMDRLRRRLGGEDLSRFFWSDPEKQQYVTEFTNRVSARWSNQHTMRATKPCWTEFFAIPVVTPTSVDNAGAAHFRVTVHKSSGPGIDYNSAGHNENLTSPAAQPTADFWQSDNTESPNFRSGLIATQERQRIEGALTAAAASPVQFGLDSDAVPPASAGPLGTFADALNQANPSAPLIPIDIKGSASAEGQAAHNQALSERRAANVAALLRGRGVRQPLRPTGLGPVGSPGDAANRKTEITVDHAFETTYASNRYSVSEHEFGHMVGLPDEYEDVTVTRPTSALVGTQTTYTGLVTSAGLSVPTFGQDTSSQMSAGVDVLPRHYVTFWEALAQMTTPDLAQADWSLR